MYIQLFTVWLVGVVNDENLFLHHITAVNAPLSEDNDYCHDDDYHDDDDDEDEDEDSRNDDHGYEDGYMSLVSLQMEYYNDKDRVNHEDKEWSRLWIEYYNDNDWNNQPMVISSPVLNEDVLKIRDSTDVLFIDLIIKIDFDGEDHKDEHCFILIDKGDTDFWRILGECEWWWEWL